MAGRPNDSPLEWRFHLLPSIFRFVVVRDVEKIHARGSFFLFAFASLGHCRVDKAVGANRDHTCFPKSTPEKKARLEDRAAT